MTEPAQYLDNLPGPAPTGPQVTPELITFAASLRRNTGRWSAYPRPLSPGSAHTTRRFIVNATAGAFRDGGFEAAVRGGVLYVRYVGGEL